VSGIPNSNLLSITRQTACHTLHTYRSFVDWTTTDVKPRGAVIELYDMLYIRGGINKILLQA